MECSKLSNYNTGARLCCIAPYEPLQESSPVLTDFRLATERRLSPDSTFAADLVGVGADGAGSLGAVAARLGENAIATKRS